MLAMVLAAAATAAGPPNEAVWKKLAPYTYCVNEVSSQVYGSRSRYGDWVNFKKGPSTGQMFASWGLWAIGSTRECTEGLARAAATRPSLPELEAAVEPYVRALGEIVPLVNEAHAYYAEGDFKDDKMAKGKALHPRLMAAWERFSAADAEMHRRLGAVQDRLEEEEIAWLEKSGRRLPLLRARMMRRAKELAREVKLPKELDLAAYQARLEAYQASLGELEAAEAYPGLSEAGRRYLSGAKELLRRRRDNKTKYGSMSPEKMEGHPVQVIGAYNDLVDLSNAMGR